MVMFFCGSFNPMFSEKASVIFSLLKFKVLSLGLQAMRLGGVVSFGPPVGATIFAHEVSRSTPIIVRSLFFKDINQA